MNSKEEESLLRKNSEEVGERVRIKVGSAEELAGYSSEERNENAQTTLSTMSESTIYLLEDAGGRKKNK